MSTKTTQNKPIATGDSGTVITMAQLSTIVENPRQNPNTMAPEHYRLLVHQMRQGKFLQPILVRVVDKGALEIIDGHHRYRAAKEAGRLTAPVVITDSSDTEALAETLALNRLRGELDLTLSAAALTELAEHNFEDLLLTGFSASEIQSLVRTVPDVTEALTSLGEGAYNPEEELEQKPQVNKRFALKLVFDSESQRDEVRNAALIHGATVEAGLMMALGVI